VGILADGYASGAVITSRQATKTAAGKTAASKASTGVPATAHVTGGLPGSVRADLSRAVADIAPGLPDELMLAGMTGWIQLFGTISFELFGQFNNVIEARAEFFDLQMELMADLIGLPAAA